MGEGITDSDEEEEGGARMPEVANGEEDLYNTDSLTSQCC